MFNCSIGNGDCDLIKSKNNEEFLNLDLKDDSTYFSSLSDQKDKYSSDLRRLRSKIRILEMECDNILPQITNAEIDLKQTEDKQKHQERTLKLILHQSQEELSKAVKIRDNSKESLKELDFKLIQMDLSQEINDTIAKSNIKRIANTSKMMIKLLLKMEIVMNGLLEKAEKIKGVVLDGEADELTVSDLKWFLKPGLLYVDNFIDAVNLPELENTKLLNSYIFFDT